MPRKELPESEIELRLDQLPVTWHVLASWHGDTSTSIPSFEDSRAKQLPAQRLISEHVPSDFGVGIA